MPNLVYDIYEGATNKNLQFLVEAVHGLTTFIDAVQLNKTLHESNNEKVLETLEGKGEMLGDNIVERANSVSTALLNDEEFIEFSKKNNPELLEKVKTFKELANSNDAELEAESEAEAEEAE